MDLHENDRKKYKNETFLGSFEFALTGIKTAFNDEKNMRKHMAFSGLAIFFGLFFHLSATEWLWIVLSIFLVVIMEILNSVVENIVDLATDYHYHFLAKKAKDMAAGAVLLVAIFSIIVAFMIFGPKIWRLIF